MTQRIFDVENEKDMQDLWHILPESCGKITVGNIWDCVWEADERFSYRSLFKINWHDKTEITRPIQEATEADIGKWCCLWDNCSEDVMIGKLSVIVQDSGKPSYRLGCYAVFDHARRLTKQEIEELI